MFTQLETKDSCVLSLKLGEGDTIFGAVDLKNGNHGLLFFKLKDAIGAGATATEEQARGSKPYFSLVFTDRRSMVSLMKALGKTYKKSKEARHD